MKKLISLMLSAVMTLSMSLSSFADTVPTGDFTDEQYERYISTDFYKDTVYPEKSSDEHSAAPRFVLPISEYPVGSYFSESGKACTHHNNCSWTGSCGCRSYNNSIQCMGFANYVFKQVTGTDCVDSNSVGGLSNISATSLKNYFSHLTVGSHFRYMGTNGIPHSFIITGITSNGVSVYEANYASNNCVVGRRTITYSTLASQVSYVRNSWIA